MENITIQVDNDVAKHYLQANPKERQTIQILINSWLKQTMKERAAKQIASRALDEIIQEMQNQAKVNGLTEDILDEILKDG